MNTNPEPFPGSQKNVGWKPAKVVQMNGETMARELPADHQIVTERWNRAVAVPYLIYMPEKDKLLMLVSCDYPHRPMVMSSDDHGRTWSEPNPVPRGDLNRNLLGGVSLTYLGRGRVAFASSRTDPSGSDLWMSRDYGETWDGPTPMPLASNGLPGGTWDPYLVDRDPDTGDVTRLTRSLYNHGVNDVVNMERALAAAEKVYSFPIEWQWRSDPEDRGLAEGWHQQKSFESWPARLRIDRHWTEQGEPLGLGWYATRFEMPETGGIPLLILFSAIDGYCDVFLDGRKVGEQKAPLEVMWDQPFYISLAEGLAPGGHTLVIRVQKDSCQAGIHKPIWIFDESLKRLAKLDNSGRVLPLRTTGYATAYSAIRFSYDCGLTWSDDIVPPSWNGAIDEVKVNEVAFCRAGNGTIIAAVRMEPTDKIKATAAYKRLGANDHFGGLGVSLSKDDGGTWTKVRVLYDYGRHHPCMVLMPNGDVVMTHVVRLGYPRDANDFPQFGIEAIVSRDNGETWDLAHRYVLAKWSGNHKGGDEWIAMCQATSTVLLPDGSLVTAFGTSYRSRPLAESDASSPLFGPRDVGLVHWRLAPSPSNVVSALASGT